MKEPLNPGMLISILFLIGGIVFLFISMFGKLESNWPLCACFACIILSNVAKLLTTKQNK